MPTFIRFQPQQWMVHHVTSRCRKGYAFLKPTQEVNTLFLGVLGRAQHKFKDRILVHNLVVMSNHYHMILSTESAYALSEFMCLMNSGLARLANRYHQRHGYVFERRFASEELLDEEALSERLMYLFGNSMKEGLVRHPHEWPGVHCSRALCDGAPLIGESLDRSMLRALLASGEPEDSARQRATRRWELGLHRLRQWSELSHDEYREKCICLLESTVEQYSRDKVLGVEGVLSQEIYHVRKAKKSRRPLCRALSECAQRLEREYRRQYRHFVDSFLSASHRLRAEVRATSQSIVVQFPKGGVPLYGGGG